MKPPRFEYLRAESAAGAVAALAEHGEGARILAGGMSLVPMMNFRLAQPTHLVDITHVAELQTVEVFGGEVVIGAAVRQVAVERSEAVQAACPLLIDALHEVAHPTVRNRGTVCGSLAHADPSSELASVALTLDATFVIEGPGGRREVPAREFFLGPYTTAINTGEMLVQVRFPSLAAGAGTAIAEFNRTHGNFALAGATALVELASDGTFSRVALTVFGAGSSPWRATATEEALVGKAPTAENIDAASEFSVEADDCRSDMHGSASYRSRVARAYAARVLTTAASRAGGNN